MAPADAKFKRFKLAPKYPHHRSDGMTHRRNKGSALQSHTKRESEMAAAHTYGHLEAGGEARMEARRIREQRRYEISRDLLAALLVDGNTVFHNYAENRPCKTPEESQLWGSRAAVEWADALLKALEK